MSEPTQDDLERQQAEDRTRAIIHKALEESAGPGTNWVMVYMGPAGGSGHLSSGLTKGQVFNVVSQMYDQLLSDPEIAREIKRDG